MNWAEEFLLLLILLSEVDVSRIRFSFESIELSVVKHLITWHLSLFLEFYSSVDSSDSLASLKSGSQLIFFGLYFTEYDILLI